MEVPVKHTEGKWEIIDHPIANRVIAVKDVFNEAKEVFKYKVICELGDWRGDSFTTIDSDEREANEKILLAAPQMLKALITAHDTLSKLNINGVADNSLLIVSSTIEAATIKI